MRKEYVLKSLANEKKIQTLIQSTELSQHVKIVDRIVTHPSFNQDKIALTVDINRTKDEYAFDLLVQLANL